MPHPLSPLSTDPNNISLWLAEAIQQQLIFPRLPSAHTHTSNRGEKGRACHNTSAVCKKKKRGRVTGGLMATVCFLSPQTPQAADALCCTLCELLLAPCNFPTDGWGGRFHARGQTPDPPKKEGASP